MRRRAATGWGVLLALSSVAGAMAVASELAGARRSERQAYASALAEREAAAAAAADLAGPVKAARAADSRTLCLRGAETVVARMARFLDSRPIDEHGLLDVAGLARLSQRAAELDRSAELPQRMGRRRAPPRSGSSPGSGETAAAWQPLEAPERICVDLVAAASRSAAHGSRRAVGAK